MTIFIDRNMNNLNELLELKFIGDDISPELIKAKDLAELITAFEDSILRIVLNKNPELIEENKIVGLVNIEKSSAKFRFKPSYPSIALSAFLALSNSITQNNYSKSPLKSVESLVKISEFSKRHNCTAEFRSKINSPQPEAIITPSTLVEVPESLFITGETTIYGKIERVGGAKPKVMIRSEDNNLIICDISEEMAQQLGHKLYKISGFVGSAKWRSDDYSFDSFNIETIIEY